MPWLQNMTGMETSHFSSLYGAASEQTALGLAAKAGFFPFYKVWRDQPYDMVIDFRGQLFRVEVKGTTCNSLSCTRSGRSGVQIQREISKERPISTEDCDFIIGLVEQTGEGQPMCYVFPALIVEIVVRARNGRLDQGTCSLSTTFLAPFRDAWHLFAPESRMCPITSSQLREMLSPQHVRENAELDAIEQSLGITESVPRRLRVKGLRATVRGYNDPRLLRAWLALATFART